MAIICSQCSHVNPDQSGFCVRCGNRLPATGQTTGQLGTGPFSPGSSSASFPTYVSPQSAAPTTGNGNSAFNHFFCSSSAAHRDILICSKSKYSLYRDYLLI